MKSAVVVFPGSNREHDMVTALQTVFGRSPYLVWHKETNFPKVDLVVIPGGFSYGDYLRVGSMASCSPVMREIISRANQGVFVLGICNGFQVLTETGLLPGALLRNVNLKFVCKDVFVKIEKNKTPFFNQSSEKNIINVPIAHHDGNYYADSEKLDELEGGDCIVLRYCGPNGEVEMDYNPNGSQRNIAGICNEAGNVLGMMPHPENAVDSIIGSTDGSVLFKGILAAVR